MPQNAHPLGDQREASMTANRTRARVLTGAVATLAAAALVLTGCTSSGTQVPTEAGKPMSEKTNTAIQKVIDSAMELSGSSQALVGIWAPWEGDFVTGISTDGAELSAGTQYRAAQSSQAVICAALLNLAKSGTISLNRKVSKDVPRQVGIDGITYGQLCDGTSGLADYKDGLREVFNNNPKRIWPEREIIAAGIVDSPLSKPGAELHVSDTNAVLLGRGLSLALRQPLDQILKEQVFDPMGMGGSIFPSDTTYTLSGSALTGSTYAVDKGALICESPVQVEGVSNSMLWGAGGTATTMGNLRDFYADYVAGAFEDGTTKGTVTKTRPVTAKTESAPESLEKWGFGLMNIGPLWGNAGSITGTLSAAYHDPASGYTVIVVLNNSAAGADFAKNLALKLTSVVAKNAPGTLAELPWDETQVTEALKTGAVCQD